MEVTLMKEAGVGRTEIPGPTNEDLENEYRYILAQQLAGQLREKGVKRQIISGGNGVLFSTIFPLNGILFSVTAQSWRKKRHAVRRLIP